MVDKRASFLAACIDAIEKVKTDDWGIEEAADHLVSLLMLDDTLLAYPEVKDILGALGATAIPREVSYAQPIGTWNAEAADQIKTQEWAQVVAAIEDAEGDHQPITP